MFLGPSGVHTLDPTIKPKWIETVKYDHGVLSRMGRVKEFDADAWVDETYVMQAYKELGLDYAAQKAGYSSYEISGTDPLCGGSIAAPREAGEVWIEGGALTAYKSANCTLAAVRKATESGKKVGVAFVFDQTFKIKLFADKAFYSLVSKDGATQIVPFLLKKDAEAHAAANGGKAGLYADALAVATVRK
jgi:NitT/TauT family transport system substrate-binding protein